LTISAVDVAEYILKRQGRLSAFKLQKLVYYSEAWHLVHLDGSLVHEDFEAWVNGPVVRELFQRHRGQRTVSTVGGDASKLVGAGRELVDEVLGVYAPFDSGRLIEMTHADEPWREARRGLGPMEPSNRLLRKKTMHRFYSDLLDDPDAEEL
jgi:uncharacterized phage-associated protein